MSEESMVETMARVARRVGYLKAKHRSADPCLLVGDDVHDVPKQWLPKPQPSVMGMIPRDAEPIAHRPPRPRIEQPRYRNSDGAQPSRSILELLEADRIWNLIVETSRT